MFEFGKRTYIMGILNVTPDSFSDGGDFTNIDIAIDHAKDMVNEGADIIDLGAESTRPGYVKISDDEEIKRLLPVIKRLTKEVKAPISVDTYKSEVANAVLEHGVYMINDIWGLQYDENMARIVAKHDAYVCIMHNQDDTNYNKDIMESIKDFLLKSIKIAKESGIKDDKIILDPGIGFGKTYEQNIEVLRRLSELKDLGYPILLGTSRKSTIGKILGVEPKERVEGTIATTVAGIIDGIDIVRVHDVKENLMAAKVADAIYRR